MENIGYIWGISARSHMHPYPEPVVFQWQSNGNPVCLELRPQCTLECHWIKICCSQCASSGLSVAFQCVPIMQINTGSPLVHHWALASVSVVPVASQCTCGSSGLMQINTGSPLKHHWVLASVSVVPVASQCTCGASGLPVWSAQWYPSALTESGLEVVRSGHFPPCNPLRIQLVW